MEEVPTESVQTTRWNTFLHGNTAQAIRFAILCWYSKHHRGAPPSKKGNHYIWIGIGGDCGAVPPTSMRILSWNCRGLGSLQADRAMRRLIADENPDVVFLMETRRTDQEMLSLRRNDFFSNIFHVCCTRRNRHPVGGLCLFWKKDLNITIIQYSLNHILFTVEMPCSNSKMQCLAIYGFPESQNKTQTWNLVKSFTPDVSVPWACFGDFNDLLSPNDKLGGNPPNLLHLQSVLQTCNLCGLSDAGYNGYTFTWSNKRQYPATVEERLDYVLVNESWRSLWPHVSVHHLSRYKSDHNAILFESSVRRQRRNRRRNRIFRFEQLWLQSEEECTEVVAEAWSQPSLSFPDKVNSVCGALDSWGKQKFGDLPKQIAKTKLLLQNLQRSVQTAETIEATRQAEAGLDSLLVQEEVFWSQRSRATWLQQGDKNTSFFHKKASQRRQRNLIEEITDDAGNKFVEDEEIAEVLKDYFSNLFTSSSPTGIEDKTALVAGRITPAFHNYLATTFRREEVEEALFQMHPTKAPGMDGLPTLFYQKFWHIIGDDVSSLCLRILRGELSPVFLNHTRLVLIPKIKRPVHD